MNDEPEHYKHGKSHCAMSELWNSVQIKIEPSVFSHIYHTFLDLYFSIEILIFIWLTQSHIDPFK